MTNQWAWNNSVVAAACIRCGSLFEVNDYPLGCPICLNNNSPSSLKLKYDTSSTRGLKDLINKSTMPFLQYPSLGEGDTPLISFKKFDATNNLRGFWIKNESLNPTGSHKDRMSPYVVARAIMNQQTDLVIASSGNAGISLAAYAAYDKLNCTVIITNQVNEEVKRKIKSYGANLKVVSQSHERWNEMCRMVEEGYYPATNYLLPPVGSNYFGVQGYKMIAYEIIRDLNTSPSTIIVPTSRGDLLWGIFEGFIEAKKIGVISQIPRMVAVEPFERLYHVLKGTDYRTEFQGTTQQSSIAGSTVTYQAYRAIIESRGTCVVVDDEEAKQAQSELTMNGLSLELSSASILPALKQLVAKKFINDTDTVVAIATSSGG